MHLNHSPRPRFDTRVGSVRVKLAALAAEIHAEGQYLAAHFTREELTDPDEPDSEPYTDIRLQVVDGGWQLNTGDAGYDQDHRGYWGTGSVSPECSKAEARRIAKDLIEQAADQYAQSEGE